MSKWFLILSFAVTTPAFAVEADVYLGLEGRTEGRSKDVDTCTTGNCAQKQFDTPATHDVGAVDAIYNGLMNSTTVVPQLGNSGTAR